MHWPINFRYGKPPMLLALVIVITTKQIFEKISKRFSQAEVPLVYEVLPMLARLRRDLQQMSNNKGLPNVIRIAAIAGLLVLNKYDARFQDTEVYRIALGKIIQTSPLDI